MLRNLEQERRLRHRIFEAQPVDKVGQVLLKAADILDEHGWCNTGPTDEQGGVCLIVAIGRAISQRGFERDRIRDACVMRLYHTIGMKRLGPIDWNESVCRSKEEAVGMLRKAAYAR